MSTRYSIYVEDIIKLVRTLVIKSSDIATSLNQWVSDHYGADTVDSNDPYSWKYYLNISGEYHFSDSPIQVISWDTLEVINFTKENLKIHTATKKAYQYGTIQYNDLVKKYSSHEYLINGILNPVNIKEAIEADDGKILGYDNSCIESNEYNLLSDIQNWIYSFRVRWHNQQFAISDDLYTATNLGLMFLNLVPAIINFRLSYCKTNQAHSYHITEYLLSRGVPEVSIRHMTKKQMLFFYRNINYIQRNAGKKDTFNWLVENIMFVRSLPISQYKMKHDNYDQLNTLLPEVKFKNIPLTSIYGFDDNEYFTLDQILEKEQLLALGNTKHIPDVQDKLKEQFENSLSSTVQTKLLESSIIDYTDAGQHRIEDISLNHWLYLSTAGIYRSYITIQNPLTEENIPISVKDAFILMIYAFAKSLGIDIVAIPDTSAIRVQRIVLPTITEMLSISDNQYKNTEVAKALLSTCPATPKDLISVDSFTEHVNKVYLSLQQQLAYSCIEETYFNRAIVENMMYRIYGDVVCKLVNTPITYEQWLDDKHLDFSNLTKEEFRSLYETITIKATGLDLEKEPTLTSLQAAMIKLFEYLSSYSIQFIKNINSNGLINLRTPPVRVGNFNSKLNDLIEFYDLASDVMKCEAGMKSSAFIPTETLITNENIFSCKTFDRLSLDVGVDIGVNDNDINFHYQFETASPSVMNFEIIKH